MRNFLVFCFTSVLIFALSCNKSNELTNSDLDENSEGDIEIENLDEESGNEQDLFQDTNDTADIQAENDDLFTDDEADSDINDTDETGDEDIDEPEDLISFQKISGDSVFSNRANHSSIVYDNKIWVIGGYDINPMGDVWYSEDGKVWNYTTPRAGFFSALNHTSLVFKNKMWVLGGGASQIDGLSEDVYSSKDGVEWVNESYMSSFGYRTSHASVVFKDKMWVIGGLVADSMQGSTYPANDVWSSVNGNSWIKVKSNANFKDRAGHSCVVFNDKIYLIGGDGENETLKDVWSSSDGSFWTLVTETPPFSPRAAHQSFVYDGKIWIMGGFYNETALNDVWSSTDGVNWEQSSNLPFSDISSFRATVFNNSVYLTGGVKGDQISITFYNSVWRSQDLETWADAVDSTSFQERAYHRTVQLNDEIFVIGGQTGTFNSKSFSWKSSDAIIWTKISENPSINERYYHSAVSFKNKIWITGGVKYQNFMETPYENILSSQDGENWVESVGKAPFGTRQNHSSIVFMNKIWVIGGYSNELKNDVWSSEDGINWTIQNENAAFSARRGHSTAVFDDKLWLVGGESSGTFFQDVWYSEDGVNWNLATDSAPFSPRTGHEITVYDNKLWVIGGEYDSEKKDDVWYSEDGVDWIRAVGLAPFGYRIGFSVIKLNDKFCIVGGKTEDFYYRGSYYTNGVWCSEWIN